MRMTPKHASLPMYDFAGVSEATDFLWSHLRRGPLAEFRDVPDRLTRGMDLWDLWQSENLFLAQTCGFPFVHKLRGQVGLVGTPDYGVVPEKPGWYYSVVLCRHDDPRRTLADFEGATFALNETGSQSGCQALMHTLSTQFGPEKFLGDSLLTGAHVHSALALWEGKADIAAVDIVTWLHIQRDHPEVCGLRVLLQTEPTPGLPYITANAEDAVKLGECIAEGIQSLPAQPAETLFLKGFWRSSEADYDVIEARARAANPVFESYFPNGLSQ